MSSVSQSQPQQPRLKDTLSYLIFHFTGTDPLTVIIAFVLFTLTLAVELFSVAARYYLVRLVFFPFYIMSLILDVLQQTNNSTAESLQGFQGLLSFINNSTHIAGFAFA